MNNEEDKRQSRSGADASAPTSPGTDIDMRFVLERPFKFEGEKIESVDMNGLLDMTLTDLDQVERWMNRTNPEWKGDINELYAAYVASIINNKPQEWLLNMGVRDAKRLRNMVFMFFYVRV
jgi:hypothetical protein